MSQCPAKDAELKKTGRLVVSASFDGLQAAFTFRPCGVKTQVTDGPYAEAKELVGGVILIEAPNKEEAIRIASLDPAATLGESIGWAIEVHPIGFVRSRHKKELRLWLLVVALAISQHFIPELIRVPCPCQAAGPKISCDYRILRIKSE